MDVTQLEGAGNLGFGIGYLSSTIPLTVSRNTDEPMIRKIVNIVEILERCNLRYGDSSKLEKHLRREQALLRKCDHPHIINLLDFFEEPKNVLNLFFENCPGGTLKLAIERSGNESFQESKVRSWLKDLTEAIDYLHYQDPQILHRNIKDESVYFTVNDVVKLGDFAFARVSDEDLENIPLSPGSDQHLPPEYFQGLYTGQSEVWSLGALAYRMTTFRYPFERTDRNMVDLQPIDTFKYSQGLWKLIRSMLETDCETRASVDEVLKSLDELMADEQQGTEQSLELKLANALEELEKIRRELQISENERNKLLEENKSLKSMLNKPVQVNPQWLESSGSVSSDESQGSRSLSDGIANNDQNELQNSTVHDSVSLGEMPFLQAAKNGALNEVEAFLAVPGADFNVRGDDEKTALHFASENGHVNIVQALLIEGANAELVTTSEKNTCLHLAAKRGQGAVVEILVKKMSNVNVRNKDGKTALHMAAEFNQTEVCKILCQKAKTELSDNDGYLPIHIACMKNHLDALKVLVDGGVKIRSKGPDGWLPLHLACKHNSVKVIKYLLDLGFSVNDQDHLKWTPLHVAFYYSNQKVIELLTKRGADAGKLTISMKRPQQLANQWKS